MIAPTPVRRFQLTAFRLGMAAGLLTLVVGSLVVRVGSGTPPTPPFNVAISASGADLTAHGARRLLVRSSRGQVSQDCNEGCDDLWVWARSGEDVFRVQALDPLGKGLIADGAAAVPADYNGEIRISVAGAKALKIETPAASGGAAKPRAK